MKQSLKITLCAVSAATVSVVMLLTNIPVFVYTVPALSGMILIMPAVESGTGSAFLCFAVSSVLSFILPTELEARILFLGFFGYYPVLKLILDRHLKKLTGYAVKLVIFNAAIIISYAVITRIMGVGDFENSHFGVLVTELLFLAAGNVVFFIFDIALTRVTAMYMYRLHPKIARVLKSGK